MPTALQTNAPATPRPSASNQRRHWCVVGGGMLGLSLANELQKRGVRVTVLEAGPELGGLASPWELHDAETGRDLTWDRHYHVTLLSDTRLRQLLEEIGLAEDMRWIETKTGFYSGGKMYSMSSTLEFLTFPPAAAVGEVPPRDDDLRRVEDQELETPRTNLRHRLAPQVVGRRRGSRRSGCRC